MEKVILFLTITSIAIPVIAFAKDTVKSELFLNQATNETLTVTQPMQVDFFELAKNSKEPKKDIDWNEASDLIKMGQHNKEPLFDKRQLEQAISNQRLNH